MLSHHLKTSFRQLFRNKLFSLINISGLVIGMVSFLLIFQYVRYELSYESFHKNKKDLYRVCSNSYNGKRFQEKMATCPSALAPTLSENFSEITGYARLLRAIRMIVSDDEPQNNYRSDNIYFADSSFLNMFSFPVSMGKPNTALSVPNTAVITLSLSKKYFGNENSVGKFLRFHSRYFDLQCQITAVLKDVPENSHLHFDALISMSSYQQQRLTYGGLNDWNSMLFFTYLKLKEGTDPLAFEKKWTSFIDKESNTNLNGEHNRYTLDNIGDIHLTGQKIKYDEEATTNKQIVYLLLGIAFVIMIIAWVNYINLSTAKALDRAKETGVRKVAGASKLNLIGQVYMESFIFNGFGMLLALLVSYYLGSAVNNLLDRHIDYNIFKDITGTLLVVLLFAGGILISGTYPAFVLASYKPGKVLKSKYRTTRKTFDLRKGLVVFQFAASIFLITGVFVIYKQVNYLQNIDLGLNAKQQLVVRAPVLSSDSLFRVKMETLKEEIKQYPEVKSIAGSYAIPGRELRLYNNLSKPQNDPVSFNVLFGDIDFVPSFGFKLLCGRGFDQNIPTDKSAVILNEEGVKALGYNTPESALDQYVYEDDKTPRKIIGVIGNYQQISAKLKFKPTYVELSTVIQNYYTIHLQTSRIDQSLALVKTLWKDKFPGDPFDYFFLDEFMNIQYKTDLQFGSLFLLFTCVAIFIACLGLFGLSYQSTRLRTKEIGIRKTLGSTVQGIVTLLARDTFLLILISSLVALPGSLLFISSWLNSYAFHIGLNVWIFLLPVVFLIIIGLGTVIIHVFKTASTNPVEALRYE
jgi:putative ABC transport system permease protein